MMKLDLQPDLRVPRTRSPENRSGPHEDLNTRSALVRKLLGASWSAGGRHSP